MKKVVSLHPHLLVEAVDNRGGLVVQLVRIHACHAWGREFESRPDRFRRKEDDVCFARLPFCFSVRLFSFFHIFFVECGI